MLSWHKAGRLSCKKEWMHPKKSAFLLCFPQTWVVYPSRKTWIKVDYIAQFGMKRNIHKDVGRGTREPPKIWANNTDSNALEFFSPEIQETKLPGKARQKGISMCNSRGIENHLYFRLSHLKAVSFRKGNLSKAPAFPEMSGKPHPMGILSLLGQCQPQTLQFSPSHHQLPSPAVTFWGFMPEAIKFLFLAMSFTLLVHFTPGEHKNGECFPGTFLHFHIQAIKELIPPIHFTFLAWSNKPYF